MFTGLKSNLGLFSSINDENIAVCSGHVEENDNRMYVLSELSAFPQPRAFCMITYLDSRSPVATTQELSSHIFHIPRLC